MDAIRRNQLLDLLIQMNRTGRVVEPRIFTGLTPKSARLTLNTRWKSSGIDHQALDHPPRNRLGTDATTQQVTKGDEGMPPIRAQAAERIRRDHDIMICLVRRIKATCTQSGKVDNCNDCELSQRPVCHGNIEQLVSAFVEVTLKHNLLESVFMQSGVPHAHRIAHNQAHMDIAQQLKAIRVVFAEDGNCVLAIEGVDQILETLKSHANEYDQALECYLLAPA